MLGPQAFSNQSGLGIEQCQVDLGSDEGSAIYHPCGSLYLSEPQVAHRLMERIVSASHGCVKISHNISSAWHEIQHGRGSIDERGYASLLGVRWVIRMTSW